MLRVAEGGLVLAVVAAVLALGGTTPALFLAPQLIILTLGVGVLSTRLGSSFLRTDFPLMTPLLLVALVLLQLLPLPAVSADRATAAEDAILGRVGFTCSIAPYRTVSHLLLLVTYLVAFYLVLLLCQDQNAKKRLVYALVALAIFEAFYGLVQYLTGWQQIFTYVKKYYLEDATGTYINRNHFAGFLEMILPFAVAAALRQAGVLRLAVRGDSRARGLFSTIELPRLVFWCFVAATIFAALIFSRSRMGIISALISLLVVLALAGTSSLSGRQRSAVATILLLAVIGLVLWIGSDPVVTRFETLGQESSPIGQNRLAIWQDTLKLIRQRPWFGTGLGTFPVAYPSVQTVFLTFFVDHAHCDYLELASELGLPGALLLFGSIAWILARAVRQYSKIQNRLDLSICLGCVGSITAILVHSLADFNLQIPANALVFVLILAMAWSTAQQTNWAQNTATTSCLP